MRLPPPWTPSFISASAVTSCTAVLCRKAARFSCEQTAAASMRCLQCYAKPCDMWLSSAPKHFQLAQLLYHPSSGENSVLRLKKTWSSKHSLWWRQRRVSGLPYLRPDSVPAPPRPMVSVIAKPWLQMIPTLRLFIRHIFFFFLLWPKYVTRVTEGKKDLL